MLLHYDSKLPLDSTSTFMDWVRFIRLDPNWKGRLRKTSKLALSYHRARAEQTVWQRHFDAKLLAAGATLPDKAKPSMLPEKWQCDLCYKVFASTRALAMHATREHGYKKKVRYFTVGSTCHACCQDFHTRKRLSVHYEKQQKCYDVIQSCWPPFPTEMVQSLDDEDKEHEALLRKQGWWASKAFHPVLQTHGPSLPPAGTAAAQAMHNKMAQRRPSDEIAYTRLQGTQIERLPQKDSGLWWNRTDLPAFIMQSPHGRDSAGGAFAMQGLARETALLHVKALVIVHFFRQYDGGPRPLRSADHPLGIPGLTLREWNQLRISDRLLRFLLDVLVALAMMGLSGFLEHPQFPTWCTRGCQYLGNRSSDPAKKPGLLFSCELRPMHGGCVGEKTHNTPPTPLAPGEGPTPRTRMLWALPSPTWLACGLDWPGDRRHLSHRKSQGISLWPQQDTRGSSVQGCNAVVRPGRGGQPTRRLSPVSRTELP